MDDTGTSAVILGEWQTLLLTLDDIRKNNKLCDMVVGDESENKLYAHSLLLIANSPLMYSTLTLEQSQTILRRHGLSLRISGITVDHWERILHYMYRREISLTGLSTDDLQSLFDAVRKLQMTDLEKLLYEYCLRVIKCPLKKNSTKGTNVVLAPISTDTEIPAKDTFEPKTEDLDSDSFEEQQALKAMEEDLGSEDGTDKVESDGLWTCQFCECSFYNKRDLVVHRESNCDAEDDFYDAEDLCRVGDSEEPDNKKMRLTSPKSKMKVEALGHNNSQGEYICFNGTCGWIFSSKKSYMNHLFDCICATTSINPINCVSVADSKLIYNDNATGDDLPDDAILCPAAVLLNKDLDDNTTPSWKTQQLQCTHCPYKCTRMRMIVHLAAIHGKRQPYHCKICRHKYSYFESVKDHYLSHHTQISLMCDECNEVFHKKDTLRRHKLMIHKNKNGTPYECKGCGKGFKYSHHARRHEKYHARTSERQFPCSTCNKHFATKQDLDRHMAVHFPKNTFLCSLCPYSTSRRFNLTLHERTRHQINKGHLLCISCNKTFTSESRFQSHLKGNQHMGVIMGSNDIVLNEADQPLDDETAMIFSDSTPGSSQEGVMYVTEDGLIQSLGESHAQAASMHVAGVAAAEVDSAGLDSDSMASLGGVQLLDVSLPQTNDGTIQLIDANTMMDAQGITLQNMAFIDPSVLENSQFQYEAVADGKTIYVYGIQNTC